MTHLSSAWPKSPQWCSWVSGGCAGGRGLYGRPWLRSSRAGVRRARRGRLQSRSGAHRATADEPQTVSAACTNSTNCSGSAVTRSASLPRRLSARQSRAYGASSGSVSRLSTAAAADGPSRSSARKATSHRWTNRVGFWAYRGLLRPYQWTFRGGTSRAGRDTATASALAGAVEESGSKPGAGR